MPVYSYKAIDAEASNVTGEVTADTPRQARDLIRGRGLTIERVHARQDRSARGFWQKRWARRHRAETVGFIRDLATLLGAGIPLLEALDTLAEQYKGALRGVVLGLREHIAAGRSLAEAMESAPAVFDELCVGITRVGESAGTLDAALARLADFKEHAHRLRSRVGTALLYPAVVALVGLAVTIFLMTFVVPNLLSTLVESGRRLPAVTAMVKGASDFLIGYGWLLLGAVAGLAMVVRLLLVTPAGRRVWDRALLRTPLVGELVRKETIARLAVVLAALLRSGVVFVQALATARRTVRNSVFEEALRRCEEAIGAGQDISPPLERTGVFPPMVVHMLAVGQQAGELEGVLEQLAAAYEHHVETVTQRITAVLEPALIVVLAVMVGFVAFATILPILETSNVL